MTHAGRMAYLQRVKRRCGGGRFLVELVVTPDWSEVVLLRRLGAARTARPALGEAGAARGPCRLRDWMMTEVILADEVRRETAWPP